MAGFADRLGDESIRGVEDEATSRHAGSGGSRRCDSGTEERTSEAGSGSPGTVGVPAADASPGAVDASPSRTPVRRMTSSAVLPWTISVNRTMPKTSPGAARAAGRSTGSDSASATQRPRAARPEQDVEPGAGGIAAELRRPARAGGRDRRAGRRRRAPARPGSRPCPTRSPAAPTRTSTQTDASPISRNDERVQHERRELPDEVERLARPLAHPEPPGGCRAAPRRRPSR